MKLELYPNLTGIRGTERTVAHMRRLVEIGKTDPQVVLQAHKIVKGIDRNDQYAQASAIFRYVHDRIAYVRDPVGVEFVKSPAITLKTRTGDCDDQAVLFSALAESIGITTRFKAVKADKRYPSEFSHVYSQAEIPGRGWVSADTIVPQAKFGWEAKGFTARTWGGTSGMSFITAGDAAGLGDVVFAAGSVAYDEDDVGTTFGSPFGDMDIEAEDSVTPEHDTRGSMWAPEPILASGDEQIDTIVDADEDFWGGSSDTGPGPGFESRMLPPGVGSLNVLTLGGPFRKLAKKARSAIQNVQRNVKKAVEKIQERHEERVEKIREGFERIKEKTQEVLKLSTDETREKAARTVVSKALSEYWSSMPIQVTLALLYRAQDVVNSVKEGRVSQFLKGPPPSIQGMFSALGQDAAKSILTQAFTMTPQGQAVQAATSLLKGIGQAKDMEAAQKALDKYVAGFPSARLEQVTKTVTTAYVGAGGMMPSESDRAPGAWVSRFQASARSGAKKKGGETGYEYYDLMHLIRSLEEIVAPLNAARDVTAAAYQQQVQAVGAQTIGISANLVQQAIQAGTISADEVEAALAIVKKVAEGFALTPEEQALAAKIAAGAKGSGKAWLLAIPAAAAGAAALLL